jgi:hypothetical protein
MLNKDYVNVKSSLKNDVGFVKLKLSECKDWVKNKLILSKASVKRQGKSPTVSLRAST